ncbi:glutaredoxin domain-containing protein [Brachybacterium sp. UNK5269]|uniref:glutaredoxin domain-containing protein n=1 Tax=Brachybacterium sp. UNK5269 TaxID=3408576 RepID=UPI003BB0A937
MTEPTSTEHVTEAERYLSATYYEARWVEQTAETRALLRHGQVDEIRALIEEIDENLRDFDEGGYPPDSDELYGIYTDAITRAAIPYGEPPISVDEVARQLRNVGHDVPTIDLATLGDRTGITPLQRDWVTTQLDDENSTAAPALHDVAAARLSVRRAIASITEDNTSAQAHLHAANQALSEAVETMRPEQAHPGVTAAQESVQQASERVAAVAETVTKVDVEVTLYSTPDCMGCAATKRTLDKAGVEYEEINLAEHPDLVQQFKRQGLAQAPIVETKDGERWAGFNPQKMREHGLDYRSRQQRSHDSGRDTSHGR